MALLPFSGPGVAIGTIIIGGTPNSVLFIDDDGKLAERNPGFKYDALGNVEIFEDGNSVGLILTSFTDGGVATLDLIHNNTGTPFGTFGSDGGFRFEYDLDSVGGLILKQAASSTIRDVFTIDQVSLDMHYQGGNIGIGGLPNDGVTTRYLQIEANEAVGITLFDIGEVSPFHIVAEEGELTLRFGASTFMAMGLTGNFDFQAGNIDTTGDITATNFGAGGITTPLSPVHVKTASGSPSTAIIIEEISGGEYHRMGERSDGSFAIYDSDLTNPVLKLLDGSSSLRGFEIDAKNGNTYIHITSGGWAGGYRFKGTNGTANAGFWATGSSGVNTLNMGNFGGTDRMRWTPVRGSIELQGEDSNIFQIAVRGGGGVGVANFHQDYQQIGETKTRVMSMGSIGSMGAPTSTILYWGLDVDNGSPSFDQAKFKVDVDGRFGFNAPGSRTKPTAFIDMWQVIDDDGILLHGFDDQSGATIELSIDASGNANLEATGDLILHQPTYWTGADTGLPFGEAHQADGQTFAVTMTTINVWAEIDAATTNISATELNLVTFPDDHYLLCLKKGKYLVTYSFTGEVNSVAGGDQHIESGIMVNGSIQTDKGVGHEQFRATGREKNLQGHSIINVPENGQISLALKNTSVGGRVLTIDHLNITVTQFGGA